MATQEVRAAGISTFNLKAAARTGELTRLKRGWYTARTLEWPSDRHRLLVEVELRDRTKVVASHYSGAVLLGLPVHRPDWRMVHLMRIVPGAGQSRSGLRIHRQVGEIRELDVALVIAQTALLSRESGLMAADAALARGMVALPGLHAIAEQLSGHGGHARLEFVLRMADGRRESPLESRTALVFDDLKLVLEPQFEVPGTSFRADARIRGTRVLVESDGRTKYDNRGVVVNEKLREDEIRSHGWEVVRVTHELLDQPQKLQARVAAAQRRAKERGW